MNFCKDCQYYQAPYKSREHGNVPAKCLRPSRALNLVSGLHEPINYKCSFEREQVGYPEYCGPEGKFFTRKLFTPKLSFWKRIFT